MQGVEFKQLGQGGRMGHYPVHFHLAKSTAYTQSKAFLKDSSVWDSMTRFVTVHGTHDVTLARNVGYLSVGHGYYLEDGSRDRQPPLPQPRRRRRARALKEFSRRPSSDWRRRRTGAGGALRPADPRRRLPGRAAELLDPRPPDPPTAHGPETPAPRCAPAPTPSCR